MNRQWVITRFSAYDQELAFVDTSLRADVRNNSAWNHRFFVLNKTNALSNVETVETECEYALNLMILAPGNESAWNYLLGLSRLKNFPATLLSTIISRIEAILPTLSSTVISSELPVEDEEPSKEVLFSSGRILAMGTLVHLYRATKTKDKVHAVLHFFCCHFYLDV